MNRKLLSGLLFAAVLQLIIGNSALAQDWTAHQVPAQRDQTPDPDGSGWEFRVVASSADGIKLVAGGGGNLSGAPICVSTNAGQTWRVTSAPLLYWTSLASSADGVKLIANGLGDESISGIYTSSDSGATWIRSAPFLGSVASSADGTKLVVVKSPESSGYKSSIYLSGDSGATWRAPASPATTNAWTSVASSGDGVTLAIIGGTKLFLSRDSGETWLPADVPESNWSAIASSADGSKLVAVAAFPGELHTSTDFGASWTEQSDAPPENWNVVASSADGTKLVAAGGVPGGQIYTSPDAGVTWVSTNKAPTLGGKPIGWLSVASSADGQRLIAAPSAIDGLFTLQAPVIELVALEVTQVIQDWAGSIPLIVGKDTYLRAHLQLPQTNAGPVTVSGAKLYGSAAGSSLDGSPLTPINAGGAVDVANVTNAAGALIRGQLTNSLNFRLPPTWTTSSVSLQLVWTNSGGKLVPVNGVATDATVRVSFIPAKIPRVKFFDVSWTNFAGARQSVTTAGLDDLSQRLLSCYPVASVDATQGTIHWPSLGLPTTTAVNTKLTTLRALDVIADTNTVPPLGNRIYYGAMLSSQILGEADAIPGFISSGCLPPNPLVAGRHTHSHEIGHNLGRNHDVSAALFGTVSDTTGTYAAGKCGEAGDLNYVYPLFQTLNGRSVPALGPLGDGDNALIYGLDTLTLRQAPTINPVVDPRRYFDFMGYCSIAPLDFWPSSFTFTNLLTVINTNFAASTGLARPLDQRDRTFLLIRGTMDFATGVARFLPFLTVSGRNIPPGPPAGTSFVLQALDVSGRVLQRVEFSLAKSIKEFEDTSETADFIISLAADASIHSIELARNGSLLATATASPRSPTVALSSPKGGEVYAAGSITVAWAGTDADLDPLTYTVQYSSDNGVSWQTLDTDVTGASLEVDSQELTATTQGLMRVLTSDGFHTAVAQSPANFTIKPHPPRLNLKAPLDEAVFLGDQQVFFEVDALDRQDGTLGGKNVQWFSDKDGSLGEGSVLHFPATRLSQGYHAITVSATDSDGLSNAALVHVFALRQPQPQLGIQLFGTEAYIYWPSSYTDTYVLQSSASLSSGWTTVPEKPAVSDQLQFVPVDLSAGPRFFRLLFKP